VCLYGRPWGGERDFPIRKIERTCSYLSGITFEGEILGDYMRQSGGIAVMPHPVRLTRRSHDEYDNASWSNVALKCFKVPIYQTEQSSKNAQY
jgi:hypothetical protein